MRKAIFLLFLLTILSATARAQKGTKTITAGPLISFPTGFASKAIGLKTGVGVEILGQYNFTNQSSVLLQTGLSSYTEQEPFFPSVRKRATILSLKVGYQYEFGSSGFLANVLAGTEKASFYSSSSPAFQLGMGKRFLLKNTPLTGGLDYVFGDIPQRLNVKVLITLFQRP